MASLQEEMNRKRVEDEKLQQEKKNAETRTASDGALIVEENYTVEDVERYVMQRFLEKRTDFLKKNFKKIIALLEAKEPDYIERNFGKEYYSDEKKIQKIFFKRYFLEVEPFLFFEKLGSTSNDSSDWRIWYKHLHQEYALVERERKKRYGTDMEKYAILICKKDEQPIYDKMYDNSVSNKEIWDIVAKKVFAGPRKALNQVLKNVVVKKIPQGAYMGGNLMAQFKMEIEAQKLREYNEISNALEPHLDRIIKEEHLTDAFVVLTEDSTRIIMTKNNFFCLASVYAEEDGCSVAENGGGIVLTPYDHLEMRAGERSVQFDATVSPIYTQKSSVVKSTIVGQALGGTLGGIVGASWATAQNRQREQAIANYTPLMRNIKMDMAQFCLRCQNRGDDREYITLNSSVSGKEKIEKFITAFLRAKEDDACFYGELMKDYLLEKDSQAEYSEQEFQVYARERKAEMSATCLKKYPELSELIQIEMNLCKEISNLEKERDTKKEQITKKAHQEKLEIRDKMSNLESQLNALGFLKMKEKKTLKEQLNTLREEEQTILECETKGITESEAVYKKAVEPLKKQLEKMEPMVCSCLYRLEILKLKERIF